MNKVKAGDVITIEYQDVADAYEACGDITVVEVEDDGVKGGKKEVAKIFGEQVFKIEQNDVHEDLAVHGVNIPHFTLRGIRVESLVDKGDRAKVNGEFEIYYDQKTSNPALKTYFLSESKANAIANALNHVSRKKFRQLREAVEKAEVMLEKIDKRGYV